MLSYWARVQARLSKEYGVRVGALVLDVRSREDVEQGSCSYRGFGMSMCSLIMRVLNKAWSFPR